MPAWTVKWAQRPGTVTLLVSGHGRAEELVGAVVSEAGDSVTLADPSGVRAPVTLPLLMPVSRGVLSVRPDGGATVVTLAKAGPGEWGRLLGLGAARDGIDAAVSVDWMRWVEEDDPMGDEGGDAAGSFMDVDAHGQDEEFQDAVEEEGDDAEGGEEDEDAEGGEDEDAEGEDEEDAEGEGEEDEEEAEGGEEEVEADGEDAGVP